MHSRLAAIVAAGVLAITGLATGTAHAEPTPDPTVTATVTPTPTATPTPPPPPAATHAVQCGRVTITVTKPADASVALQWRVNGRRAESRPITSESQAIDVNVREDSGVRYVWYRLGGQNAWTGPIRVESNCRSNWVRADAPSVVQPECGAERGKLVIPADRGVTYKASRDNGRYLTLRAGTYDVRPAVYRVRAYALPGYRLVGDTRWRLTIEPAKPCPTPTPTPTGTVEPTPSPTPTPDPTDPDATEEPEPEPVPTVTTTSTQTIVVRNYLPTRVDTGFGGTAK